MNEIWWKVDSNSIGPVRVKSVGKKMLTTVSTWGFESRCAIESEWGEYFKTFGEAAARLKEKATKEVASAKSEVEAGEKLLSKLAKIDVEKSAARMIAALENEEAAAEASKLQSRNRREISF